jgi:hypothetical protein
MSGEKHPMYGKHHSEEWKQKVSGALKGRIKSEEHLSKISARQKAGIFQKKLNKN